MAGVPVYFMIRSTSIDMWRGSLEARANVLPKQAREELPAVTISREALAGATTIAHLVAERLNRQMPGKDSCPWTVFDHDLIEKVLKDHKLPEMIKQFMPENAVAFSPGKVVEEMLGLHPSEWTLLHHTTDTILRLARMGNVILVGRGANVITSGCKKAFHVRLVAPEEVRIKRATELYQLTERDAADFVREKDRGRQRYVKSHFKVGIDDPLQYHVTLNTGRISFEAAAQLIAEAVIFRG